MARGRWLDILGWLGALITLVVAAQPAGAQAGLIGRGIATCAVRATPGMTSQTVFQPSQRFDCRRRQSDLGSGDYWIRSQLFTATGPVAVRSGSVWQSRSTLYARYADGKIVTRRMDDRAATRSLQLGAIFQQTLPARPVPLVQLLWHVEGAANVRGIVLAPKLATQDEANHANLVMAALYAAFGGLAFALLIYNLGLWAALRYRFQLPYCGMLLALLLYAFSTSGAMAWAFPDLPNTVRLRFNYVLLASAATFAMLFARSFFEERVFVPWLSRLVVAVCIAMLGSAGLVLLLAPWHIVVLDRLYSLAFLAQVLAVAPILWRGWRARSNYLWLFAIGWAVPVILAAMRVVAALHLSEWSFLVDNSTLTAMSIEALLSSLAIAYRVNLLSRERDVAREQEIAARMLADVDPLTGLLNRRSFLERAIGLPGEQLLLVADLDHFKAVNDTIGHDGGDEVLRLFARALRQSVPGGGLIARLGGEEFAVLVPASRPVDGEAILARLRTTRMPFDLTVTASIGSAAGPMESESDWKALYRGADRALFEAKTAGRDRFRRASGRAAA